MQIAAQNGDYITPTIVGTGENDYDRDLKYTRALFRMLVRDEVHGEANKELFGQWLTKWMPKAVAAATALQPIWSQPAEKPVTFTTSCELASQKFSNLLEELELEIPKELQS